VILSRNVEYCETVRVEAFTRWHKLNRRGKQVQPASAAPHSGSCLPPRITVSLDRSFDQFREARRSASRMRSGRFGQNGGCASSLLPAKGKNEARRRRRRRHVRRLQHVRPGRQESLRGKPAAARTNWFAGHYCAGAAPPGCRHGDFNDKDERPPAGADDNDACTRYYCNNRCTSIIVTCPPWCKRYKRTNS
jgi:hypothetical protein